MRSEQRGRSIALDYAKAEHVAVERDRPVQVGDLECDVSETRALGKPEPAWPLAIASCGGELLAFAAVEHLVLAHSHAVSLVTLIPDSLLEWYTHREPGSLSVCGLRARSAASQTMRDIG